MKLVTYRHKDSPTIGVVVGDRIVPVNALLADGPELPDDMVQLLSLGADALATIRAALARTQGDAPARDSIPVADADFLPPVLKPGKIMMGGRNYLRHLEELRAEGRSRDEKVITPPYPHIFAKFSSTLTGHHKPIIYPKVVTKLDMEGELTVIIGKRAHFVDEADALQYVAGYTVMNDVSARCLQAQGLTHISKGFETFAPLGPWLVTADEIPDPQNLMIRTYLNDQVVCSAHTSEMLFSVRAYIAFLSTVFPLEPGDVLATGSPPGPGLFHNPPLLGQIGDVMRVEIENVGVLENPIVAATR